MSKAVQRAKMRPMSPADKAERLPVSFAQQRLWFLTHMGEEASEAYHIPLALRLKGALNRSALRQAMDRLVERHEALRTTFYLDEGEPVQRIGAVEDSRFALAENDLRGEGNATAELERLAAQEVGERFDLQTGPLIRGRLIRVGEEEHVLLITMHHIVSDGWSMGVLLRELSALYGAYRAGQDDPLPELPIQYADY